VASWIEIERLRRDPDEARLPAQRLQNVESLTDWEEGFVDSHAERKSREDLTTRQAEKLVQVRDDYTFVSSCHGFSIDALIRRCFEGRLDLSEDDEAWVSRLRNEDARSVRQRDAYRLIKCARQLNIIERA
jgi:predicted glycoside hydrolase/deacetylase ChbG (UPF0249 family)